MYLNSQYGMPSYLSLAKVILLYHNVGNECVSECICINCVIIYVWRRLYHSLAMPNPGAVFP